MAGRNGYGGDRFTGRRLPSYLYAMILHCCALGGFGEYGMAGRNGVCPLLAGAWGLAGEPRGREGGLGI